MTLLIGYLLTLRSCVYSRNWLWLHY